MYIHICFIIIIIVIIIIVCEAFAPQRSCFCVKEHHGLLHSPPLLKNTCVRQVVLDK